MTKRKTRLLAWLALITLLSFQGGATALAITVSGPTSITDQLIFTGQLEAVHDSANNVHMIGISTADTGTSFDMHYYKYNGSTWASSTFDNVSTNQWEVADVAVNSSGLIGVLYGNKYDTGSLKYATSSDGINWSINTVDTLGGQGFASAALAFLNDDTPLIAVYRRSPDVLLTYKQSGSSFVSSTTGVYVNLAGAMDMVVAGANVHLAGLGNSVVTSTLFYLKSTDSGSSWGSEEEVMTDIDTYNDNYNVYDYVKIQLDSNNIPRIVVSDMSASTNYIYYSNRDASSWSAKVTIDSGTNLGGTAIGFDLDSHDNEYISYHDLSDTVAVKYAYSTDTGSSWTSAVVDNSSLVTVGDVLNISSLAAGSSEMIIVAGGTNLSTNYFNSYSLTDLPTGESESSGVPEFSTYVYLLTLTLAGYLIYNRFTAVKNDGGLAV